jgi:uncharacterized protein YutE (UPF0331/DUF86 family)
VSPRDYEDILTQLGRHGVLDADLLARLTGLGGFRNVLVRGYLRLDPAVVNAHLARAPKDFSDFSLAVRRWMDTIRE